MKSRDEVIGSVVERVIPEGWSLLRAGTVSEDDVAAWDTLWRSVNSYMVGAVTDVNGYATVNEGRTENTGRMRLVIRQDAPAEDVAKLKATIAERDETIRWYKQLEASSKARIAELELAVARSKGEIDALRGDRDLYKKRHGELTVKINAVKKAWEGA